MRRSCRVALLLPLAVVSACASRAAPPDDSVPLPPRLEPETGDASVAEAPLTDAGSSSDDGAVPTADAGDAATTAQRVFVTSTTVKGNAIQGLAGADAICAARAAAGKLGGDWVAWLSVAGGPHAADRLTHAGPFVLTTGALVAANKAVLTSGAIQHAIDHDESGAAVAAGRVWTGTGPDGQYLTNDCDKWLAGGTNGRAGNSSRTDDGWTSAAADGCGNLYRLYCFER